jgi:ABC-2 type transport system permease protein
VTWIRPFRFASLFYWAVGDQQLANGAGLGSIAVLGVVAVAAALAATVSFRRLDVR